MRHSGPKFDQSGFTLLEALVALLVLAVGLLGLAALQTQGLRFNTDAYVRSQGTYLAYDMIERIRMHPFSATRMMSPPSPAQIAADTFSYTTGDPGTPCDDVALQSGAIADELACWHAAVRNLLPGGTGIIARQTDGGTAGDPSDDVYRVTIQWTDRSQAGNTTVSQIWEFTP